MSWRERMDAMEALVLPMGRRRKRLVLEMAHGLSSALVATLGRGHEPEAEVTGYAMMIEAPRLADAGEVWQRFVREDRDCAEAAAALIAGILSYYIEQGVSAIPRG